MDAKTCPPRRPGARIGAALAVALSLSAVPAWAAPVTYHCTFGQLFNVNRLLPAHLRRDYAPDLFVDTRLRHARVLDPLIQEVFGTPVPARFTDLKDGRFRLTWDVPSRRSGGQYGWYLKMAVVVRRHDGAVQLYGTAPGSEQAMTGTGSCTKQDRR